MIFFCSLFQVKSWEKFLAYDWDPELFSSFLVKYPMTFETLMRNIRMAVNHDTNIERIVELGLAKRDLEQEDAETNQATATPQQAQQTSSNS